jgi:hypothetical protein
MRALEISMFLLQFHMSANELVKLLHEHLIIISVIIIIETSCRAITSFQNLYFAKARTSNLENWTI